MHFILDILKSLLTDWLLYWLPLAGGLVAAFLRVRGVHWLDPLLYGLTAAAAILLVVASLKITNFVALQSPRVTEANIESSVREWIDAFRIENKKLNDDPSYYWAYEIRPSKDTPITIARPREMGGYLAVIGSLVLTGPHPERFAALTKKDADALIGRLKIELNRLNLTSAGLSNPPKRMMVSRDIPISGDLTDFKFVTTVNEVTNAIGLMRQVIALELGSEPSSSQPSISEPLKDSTAASTTQK